MDNIIRFVFFIVAALGLQIITVVYLGIMARHLKNIEDQLYSLKELIKYKKSHRSQRCDFYIRIN